MLNNFLCGQPDRHPAIAMLSSPLFFKFHNEWTTQIAWCNHEFSTSSSQGKTENRGLSSTIMDASTLMDWRNAVIAMDMKRISAILIINQAIVAVSLIDIPSDIQIPVKLGNPSEMSALQYTLLTMWSYNTSMSPNEKQLTKARKQLVDLLMQVRECHRQKKKYQLQPLPPVYTKTFARFYSTN